MTSAEMMKMRLEGATYQEIADKCGVSKQDVHERVNNYYKRVIGGHRGHKLNCDEIIYKGIYEHFLDNPKESVSSFSKKLYGDTAQCNKIRQFIKGETESRFTIQQISKMCEIVGKPFEEVFVEREPSKMIEKVV